jgi:hypothetical protein
MCSRQDLAASLTGVRKLRKLKIMGDNPPARRRYQFGLRKLMLWMGVVAFSFGVAATLGDGLGF